MRYMNRLNPENDGGIRNVPLADVTTYFDADVDGGVSDVLGEFAR